MKIRKATYDDVKTINHYLTLLIREERQYDSGINKYFIVTNMYENYIDDTSKIILVAEDNGYIAGYLYGYIIPPDITYKRTISQLDALYVVRNYRQQGVATALIEAFKKWSVSQKANSMEVKVWSDNIRAKSLYKQQSFETKKETMVIKL